MIKVYYSLAQGECSLGEVQSSYPSCDFGRLLYKVRRIRGRRVKPQIRPNVQQYARKKIILRYAV